MIVEHLLHNLTAQAETEIEGNKSISKVR